MANPFKSEYDALKDTGLTPQQIKEALDKAKSLEDKTTKLESELLTNKTTLEAMNSDYKTIKQQLDSLEANSRRQPPKNEPKTFTSVVDDEDKAFDERFLDRAQPLAAAAQIAASRTAKLEAKLSLQGKYMKTAGGRISLTNLWDRWSSEIDKAAQNTQAAALCNWETWLNIFDYIKGKHVEELTAEPATFIEPVETRVNGSVGNEPPPEKLNDEEMATVGKMAKESKFITPEKYLETRKKMKFINV